MALVLSLKKRTQKKKTPKNLKIQSLKIQSLNKMIKMRIMKKFFRILLKNLVFFLFFHNFFNTTYCFTVGRRLIARKKRNNNYRKVYGSLYKQKRARRK